MAAIYDDRACLLGEGPLWHPVRGQLFWFDVLNNRMMSRDASGQEEWQFPEHVSAAGWISRHELLIASESCLFRFSFADGTRKTLCALEADKPANRSNDGRADPMGGFWIGTMGKRAEKGAGAIYRFYRGELRRLFADISISNAISFAPSRDRAYFADTAEQRIMTVALDRLGWPKGQAEVFLDTSAEGLNPDGAVVDASGVLWVAQWGAGRVAAYDPQGGFLRAVAVDAPNASCPAFGGPDLRTLFCTTARVGLGEDALARHSHSGKTFAEADVAKGQYEHQVIV